MSFTREERETWHRQRQRREEYPPEDSGSAERPICIHCNNPFLPSLGAVTSVVAICDTCLG